MDFLDEDVLIRNQKYTILSYTLPPKDPDYSTTEECQSRITKLQESDKYFNMYIAPVGIWGPLLTEEQMKDTDTSIVYRESKLNEFMQDYKNQIDKKAAAFEERRERMSKQAREDGTSEGQARLAAVVENPVSVRERQKEAAKQIDRLRKELEEFEDMYDAADKKYKTYTAEEIDTAEREIENATSKLAIE
jgi:Family of unknown function (DUF5832)